MKRFILFLTFIFAAVGISNSFAQQNFTLYNMSVIPQAAYTNPASIPDRKINIGLPILSSLYLSVSNSGFKYSDLIKKGADDSLHLDVAHMISKLAKNNYLNFAFQPDLFSFGIVVKKNYFTFNVTEKASISFRYPKDFIEFAWQGNGALLGQETKFNFGLNASHYREYGLGMAREINEKLTVGGKLKYLYGMENVHTVRTDVSQTTDANTFDITAKSNIKINTSGVDSSSTSNFDVGNYLFKKKNSGFGIDLGGTYKLTEKISLSASLLDLGFITWKSGVTNYVSRNPDASYTFKGVGLNSFLDSSGTNTDSAFTQMADTLKNIYHIDQTHNKYTTALSTQFYIGAKYILHPKFNVGGLLYGQFFDKALHPGISLSGNAKLTKWFSASLSYSMVNRSYNNFGFGMAITSPVQFYIVTDNFLALIAPQNTKNFNLRFGINITFGKKHKEGDPIVPSSMY